MKPRDQRPPVQAPSPGGRCSARRRHHSSSLARAVTAAIAATVALGCPPAGPDRDGNSDATPVAAESITSAAPPAWYARGRALDLTGDGQLDTVRLDAVGTRPDSLRITLLLIVGGAVKHREEWGSSYELALIDSSHRGRPPIATQLRTRLDSVLWSVRVQRLDAPDVRLMEEDEAILSELVPRPTHRISFAYGYETMARLVWDARRQRFVRLWSCC